ncbi:MAG: glycosyltransferase [Deltaproteobacteria bacterium]|nr:glycosyltransferase [Deltaproteobacteria bacterium]
MIAVSVIIPAFNSAPFIADAVKSVMEQTWRDFEVIVVNDGSTDDTEKRLRQLDAPISYYKQENKGVATARNLGAYNARGEWLAFLDADDLWYPNKLAVQLSGASDTISGGFYYSDMDGISESGRLIQSRILAHRLKRQPRKRYANLLETAFGNGIFPYPSTVLIKRDIFFQAGGFNSRFRNNYHEDFELWTRVARLCPLNFNPTSLVRYRVPLNKTANFESWKDENWLLLLNCLRETWKDLPEKPAALERCFAKLYSNQGKSFLRNREYSEARKHFRQASQHSPFYSKNLRRWGLSYIPGLRLLYSHIKSNRAFSMPRFKRLGV